jgi:hypothetical protein
MSASCSLVMPIAARGGDRQPTDRLVAAQSRRRSSKPASAR